MNIIQVVAITTNIHKRYQLLTLGRKIIFIAELWLSPWKTPFIQQYRMGTNFWGGWAKRRGTRKNTVWANSPAFLWHLLECCQNQLDRSSHMTKSLWSNYWSRDGCSQQVYCGCSYRGGYFNSIEGDRISSLTAKQEEVVGVFVKGNDVFVPIPTEVSVIWCPTFSSNHSVPLKTYWEVASSPGSPGGNGIHVGGKLRGWLPRAWSPLFLLSQLSSNFTGTCILFVILRDVDVVRIYIYIYIYMRML